MKPRISSVPCVAFVAAMCVAGSARAAEKVDPSGTWTWVRELEGQTSQSVLKLVYKDDKLTGTYRRTGQIIPISNARFEKDQISFEVTGKFGERKINGKFRGKVSKDAIKGDIEISSDEGPLSLAWEAKRGIDVEDIVGNWKLKIVTDGGDTIEPSLKLSDDGGNLKGAYSSRFGEHEAKDIKLDGFELSWVISGERDGRKFKAAYKGKAEGSTIKGSLDYDLDGNTGSIEFTGERIAEKKDAQQPGKKAESKQGADSGTKARTSPAGKKSTRQSPPPRRLIVSLRSRHDMLLIYSSAELGPAFSIVSNDGRTRVTDLTLTDLRSRYPELYERYRTAVVNLWAERGASAR